MNNNYITVSQYQKLYALSQKDMPDIDRITDSVGIFTGQTSDQVDAMGFEQFKKVAHKLVLVLTLQGEARMPVKYIEANGKLFEFIYNPDHLVTWQYYRLFEFLKGNVVDNLHLLAASMVRPVLRFKFFRWSKKAKLKDFDQTAELMKSASFDAIHSACAYYMSYWKNSIERLRPTLVNEMVATGMVDNASANNQVENIINAFELELN